MFARCCPCQIPVITLSRCVVVLLFLQLEQLQRDQQAATASFELSLSALKEQVTGVLNRYFSKELDLQAAMHEMQALGIEVVNMDELHR